MKEIPRVVHVMRTYGAHGGEQQLRRMFSIEASGWEEHFLHVYRDDDCSRLFDGLDRLQRGVLCSAAVKPRQSPWLEWALLMIRLPLLHVRFLSFIRRTGCRICIAHGFQAALIVWPWLLLVPGLRGAYVHRTTKPPRLIGNVFRIVYRPFRVVAGVSNAVRDSLQNLVRADRLMTLSNGIAWQPLAEIADSCRQNRRLGLVITSVGRLLPHKGHQLIIQAFSIFRKRSGHAELWIIGDGKFRPQLEELVSSLGLNESVRFLGYRRDVACWLGKSDIYVHASQIEGLSNAVLEAMAAGLPSVVVDAPGVSECHEQDVSGFIVERSVEVMFTALQKLIQSPELRERMGAAARRRVQQHYSMESNRQQYLSLYQDLAGP